MAITKEGIKKRRLTMIKKYGSEEAYLAVMKRNGKKGGSTITDKTHKRGYGSKKVS